MKNINYQKLGKCLIYTSAIAVIISIFCMFAPAIKWNDPAEHAVPSMFNVIFGTGIFERKSGMTTMFVFECIAAISLGYVLVTGLLKKENDILDNVLIAVASVCSIIVLVFAFNACNVLGRVASRIASREAILGAGSILVGTLNSIALLLNIGGIYLIYFKRVSSK